MLRGDINSIICNDNLRVSTLVTGNVETDILTYTTQAYCPQSLQKIIDRVPQPSDNIVWIRQSDFDNGTYRITAPGVYRLLENIEFNPNPADNYMPRVNQQKEYPVEKYKLGFFAAITIEVSDVLLDLNGKTIRQSAAHYLQQRFFSVIELADQPFIVGQGPASLGPSINSAANTKIMNGILGFSSHHGIHGNNNVNIALINVNVMHFEIAGIALNGCRNIALYDVNVHDSVTQVPVKATYSHARFLLPFFDRSPSAETITLNGTSYTGEHIKAKLVAEMDTTFTEWITGQPITSPLFANPHHVSDGAVYGIVFNQKGVAVNNFLEARIENNGNENIILKNVGVFNIRCRPDEVIALSSPVNSTAYRKVQTGPVGEVFRAYDIAGDDTEFYVGDALSDAQLFLSQYSFGTITLAIRQWAASGTEKLSVAMDSEGLYFVGGGDSMAHVGKGAIALFLSGCKNFRGDMVDIKAIFNDGLRSVYRGTDYIYRNANTTGVAMVTSEDVVFRNSMVTNIVSKYAQAFGVQFVNMESMQMKGIQVREVTGGQVPIVNDGNNPNPQPVGTWQNF